MIVLRKLEGKKSMKKHNGLKTFIMILVIAIILFLVMEYWFKAGIFSDDEAIFGANGNAMSFVEDIRPKMYTSLEEALADNQEKVDSEKQICQIEENGVTHVYMEGENIAEDKKGKVIDSSHYITCYDFIKKANEYYYSGGRKLVIRKSDEYTWKETFLADLSQSKNHVYKNNAEKYYKALPAWGVTDNSNVQNVTVDGQKIDEVHEIDVDGETYYLWIIYDLQTQNKASDVIIE